MLLSSWKGRVLAGAIIGTVAWFLVLSLHYGKFLEPYELKTYEHLCRLNATSLSAPGNIVLVVIDQSSLESAKRQGINWPWPRQMYAPIVQFCGLSGARAVVIDILFTEPSSYGMEDDQLLAQALKQNGRAFLPLFLSRDERPQDPWEKRFLDHIALPLQDQSERSPSPSNSMVSPIQMLAENVTCLGNVAISPDSDGIYRRLPLVFFYRGRWIPSLGLAVFRHLSGNHPLVLTKDGLHMGGIRIPIDDQGNFLLSYYGGTTDFPRFSAFNVIQSFQALQERGKPVYSPHVFRDKIVFVGLTAPGLLDLKPTPISSVNPGVAIHATLVANLLHKDFRVRISSTVVFALALGIALAMSITVMLIPILWRLSLITLAYAGSLLLFILLTFRLNIWVDGILMLASLGLSFAMSTAFSYATEGRQRHQIRQMFSHYMSEVLIQDLLKHPEKLRLGGERQILTVFFSDLVGFSSLSEKIAPEEVVTLLNRYLTAMTDIILANSGVIDKYEGDAIMAFWGAPLPQEDHATHACLAALDNQSRLAQLRQEFIQMGLPPIHARIGINTGEMIIGNLGSSQRFDFTVIGDSVNLASRLESACKEYGTRIMISEDTYHQARDRVETRELDLLGVQGKEVPVRIYELLSRKGELDETMQKVRDLFAEGLKFYRQQQWSEAVSYFKKILDLSSEDGPAKTFMRRCEEFMQTPPSPSWDGVYRLTAK
jgi:adenylate cyclase